MDSREYIRKHLELVGQGNFGKRILGSWDTETEGLYGKLRLIGWGGKHVDWVVPPTALKPTPDMIVAGHNIKYDIRVSAEQGMMFDPGSMIVDTMAGTHLLNENVRQSLKDQVVERGLYDPDFHSREAFAKWADEGWKPDMSTPELAEYLKCDVHYTYRLARLVWAELKREGLLNYWLKLECPMALVAAEMEVRGIKIDRQELAHRYLDTHDTVGNLEKVMVELAPGPWWACPRDGCVDGQYHWKKGNKVTECTTCDGTGNNRSLLTSPKQLEYLLFKEFGLKPVDYTPAGNPSTRHESLLKLRDQGQGEVAQFVHRLLEYREANKLLTAFYGPYLDSNAQRIHPNLKPWGTVTGRWACDSPNLQQVPKEVRSIFIPDPGHVFISVDYTQLELYLAGVIFGEPLITEAYNAGENLHQRTAEVAGVTYGEGKTINFSLLYGLSEKSLASRLNVTVERAAEIKRAVLSGYTGLFEGIEQAKREARSNGYVVTWLGRKRRIPNISAGDFKERIHAENQAVNAKIQGTAAELIKSATILAKLHVPDAKPLLQVHDEVLFLVEKGRAQQVAEDLRPCFEKAINGLHPKVGIRILERWE